MLKNKAAKAAWLIIVCFGFLGAFLLISRSYSNWQSSPISTAISTHPLEELDFPPVAVCPPEDSNTALNYDLMRAANHSFSKDDRNKFEEAVWKHLIADEHKSFAEEMIAATNPANMEQLYDGFHSVPMPYNYGYEVLVQNSSSGRIKSSWFQEEYNEDHYN